MEKFKERLIAYAREQHNMGQTRFEDYCGINHGTISSIKIKGPSADIIIKISSACPDLNLNWLFRGDEGGAMLLGEDTNTKDVMPLAIHGNGSGVITNDKELMSKFLSIIEEKDRQIARLIEKL